MDDTLTEPGGIVRLFVEAPLGQGAQLELGAPQAHYLLHVMRAKEGDLLCLFNGRHGEWRARISAVAKRGCAVRCERQIGPQTHGPDVWLVFAPVKKTPADYLVQKATELGVRRLQPVLTRRTIARRVNLERMRANAIEAAEQSGRRDVPDVSPLREIEEVLRGWPQERRLVFCDEAGDAPPLAEALQTAPPSVWAVLTGPEGGFEPLERDALRKLSFVVPVSLGERILRADTAALAALAIWQAILGDFGRSAISARRAP
ncbi:MAG: 16S rRNA (uracil(1498)-N(3))-methyltransferase [Alphaproteobacteria bacterium]|nr:16S rRNA (uracil(1498)-N(3))-methyltransferase [Alphaproteobacteria bacterium]MBV9692880.1 16S rRNA (uracil(1498)-N(3))-methyltransferase [Alphaproteobacteria bacterium]